MFECAVQGVIFKGGPLSNFAASPISLPDPHTREARDYATVEDFCQASKACDVATHTHVAEQLSPGAAKRAGRLIPLRRDWEHVKEDVMLAGLRAKFSLPRFRAILLATGERPIMENSPSDFEWGARDTHGGWAGRNLLGLAPVRVRNELRTDGGSPGEQMALIL